MYIGQIKIMKIAICSLYINDWYRKIVKYGKKTLECFCEKHGYDFVWETELTEDGVYDATKNPRDIPWYKILLLQKTLLSGKYDFAVWIDADSVIVSDRDLEDFIKKHICNYCMIVSKEPNINYINTGLIFAKNCAQTLEILSSVWNNPEGDWNHIKFHEQSSLQNLYDRNYLNIVDKLLVLDDSTQKTLVSYWYDYFPKSSFIIHLAQCSADQLGFIFTIDMFCPIKMEEESPGQFLARSIWLSTEEVCRSDISGYMKGHARKNWSARYASYLQSGLTNL